MDNEEKQLDALLQTYNLSSTVHFPTTIQNQSNIIDNIFINIHKVINYTVSFIQ
jgi:hypothetical protein